MKKQQSKTASVLSLQNIEPNAAGIDVGATKVYVAVPADRDDLPVRSFATFTEDLQRLADWLLQCRITTVAMESTGVYWIPVYDILEAKGVAVCLVNAHHVKHVPGRKSDVQDCQWLQYLHAVGLLRGSFLPADRIRSLRAVMRHRTSLVEMAAAHTQHMQKALTQMNLQLHHVLSDRTGVSGLAILDAIVGGERDPQKLASLRDGRVHASAETVRKSLVGNYRREHLFTLQQSLKAFRQYQEWITACDREIALYVEDFDSKIDVDRYPPPPPRNPHKPRKNEPRFDLRTQLYRLLGVDLTATPGISALTAFTVLSEIGTDLTRFRSAPAFASWLGLCPHNRQSGERLLSSKTRRTKNRINYALRVAAQSLHGSTSYLGAFYRRMRSRLGAPKAITATAHKPLSIFFFFFTTQQPLEKKLFPSRKTKPPPPTPASPTATSRSHGIYSLNGRRANPLDLICLQICSSGSAAEEPQELRPQEAHQYLVFSIS